MKAKFIKPISDIHMNFQQRNRVADDFWYPQKDYLDKHTVLVIAGDLWHGNKTLSTEEGIHWIRQISKRFHSVVMVYGNHDYWFTDIDFAISNAKKFIQELGLKNVHLLENDSVVIDEMKFVGATLWTDFNKNNIASKALAKVFMNDYQYISTEDKSRRITPDEIYNIHKKSRKFLFSQKKDYPTQKLICVSHMAPSQESVNIKYLAESMKETNFFYYSDLRSEVINSDYDYWFHGHMHDSVEYLLGKCRVIANPMGYASYSGFENLLFNPEMIIDPFKEL